MQLFIVIALLWCMVPLTAAAQEEPLVVPLWDDGAPGSEGRMDEPELAQDWWVRNIHNPSITVFLPPDDLATGVGVVICPGGGHKELVFDAEGRQPAEFFNRLGIAAFVLKYRLANEEGSPYTLDGHVNADVHRAMRLVRTRAAEWGVDPDRLGIMGFSAGGEVVSMVAYEPGEGNPDAADPVDRQRARPDFQVQVYPGGGGMPDEIPADAPPAFLLVANDDEWCAGNTIDLLVRYHRSGAPVEAHVFAKGGHAFNMGDRSDLATISRWPDRLADWLNDNILNP